ncbi:MAG: hypothetical protein ABJP02_10455 [Parasphingorhabdus sp.]|uniref:hypothetical protein n=1 Tax=Parasphingorhabdus sp. TaxID=2709688 RepID=UPI003299D727
MPIVARLEHSVNKKIAFFSLVDKPVEIVVRGNSQVLMFISQFDNFKAALANSNNQTLLDRFYFGGTCAVLSSEQEAELRRLVSGKYGVNMRDVIVTGSAKLGFTTVAKIDRPIFSEFGNTSDIDIAIISEDLFLRFWKKVFDYQNEHGNNWHDSNSFRKYHLRGWMRPDRLPAGENFPSSNEWFEFFRELTSSGKFGHYKITAGVYFNEYFWNQYVSLAFDQCRKELEKLA